MDPASPSDPVNWFVLLDLLVPFGVVLGGLIWYDMKLRRERRARPKKLRAEHDEP